MRELKAFNSERIYWAVEQVERAAGDIDTLHLDDSQFYLKSEADKVIADLEESHKKEVEQLLLTILELKEKLAAPQLVMRLNSPEALYSDLETMGRLSHKIHVVERRELHQKYKRCLVMAKWCDEVMMSCELRGYAVHRMWANRHQWAMRWKYKWLAIAEKFITNSTAQ